MIDAQIQGMLDFCDSMIIKDTSVAEEGFLGNAISTAKAKMMNTDFGAAIVVLIDKFIGWVVAILNKVKGVQPVREIADELIKLMTKILASSIDSPGDTIIDLKYKWKKSYDYVVEWSEKTKQKMFEADKAGDVLTLPEAAKFESCVKLFLDKLKRTKLNIAKLAKYDKKINSEGPNFQEPLNATLSYITFIFSEISQMIHAAYVDKDNIFKQIPLNFEVDQTQVVM